MYLLFPHSYHSSHLTHTFSLSCLHLSLSITCPFSPQFNPPGNKTLTISAFNWISVLIIFTALCLAFISLHCLHELKLRDRQNYIHTTRTRTHTHNPSTSHTHTHNTTHTQKKVNFISIIDNECETKVTLLFTVTID